jgi:hypothetical protein
MKGETGDKIILFITKWKDIEFIVASIGVALSLFATALTTYYSHILDKNKYSVDILKEWNDKVKEYREPLYAKFPELSSSNPQTPFIISTGDASAIINSYARAASQHCATQDSTSETCKCIQIDINARNAANALLSHLNYLSIAYELDTVDSHAYKEGLYGVFARFFLGLSPYIKSVNLINTPIKKSNPTEAPPVFFNSFVRTTCRWNDEDTSKTMQHNQISELCKEIAPLFAKTQ